MLYEKYLRGLVELYLRRVRTADMDHDANAQPHITTRHGASSNGLATTWLAP